MMRTILFLCLSILPALSSGCAGPCSSFGHEKSSAERVMEVVPLQFASAGEMAGTLNQAMAGQSYGACEPRIVADPRTNSLIVMVKDQDELARVKELIKRLDVETPKPH